MNKLISIAMATFALALLGGCDHNARQGNTQAMDSVGHRTAVAHITPAKAATTQPGMGTTNGTVTFTQTGPDTVKVSVDLTGLPPGKHGFHIHQHGDLSAPDLSSAGGHFNPTDQQHGAPKSAHHHAGDLGNINANASGEVKKEMTVKGISIGTGQPDDIVGKAVIVHANADDLKSQPSGNAGGRIAGGVIEMNK